MLQLSFNQKVAVGFATIILLLVSSSLTTLWNLSTIDDSSSLVNEKAIPVVKESNSAQIQLLKLVKLSSLAFNAEELEQIEEYQNQFEKDASIFTGIFTQLEESATSSEEMKSIAVKVKHNYELYSEAVRGMFTAMLDVLIAREKMAEETDNLLTFSDDVGAALLEIIYYQPPEEFEEQMEMILGNAEQADLGMVAVVTTLEEYGRSTDVARFDSGMDELLSVVNGAHRWYGLAKREFNFDEDGLTEVADEAYAALYDYIENTSPSLVDYKIKELNEIENAKIKLNEATAAVGIAVEGLDELLALADSQFNTLQSEVSNSLSFGFKLAIGMGIVLVILAAQNFNSMRSAIQKKMIDLAKLNTIGGTLAAAQSQSSALEEVLQSMQEKIGVAQGSVYLTNDNQQLEVKAHFPPKAIEQGAEPAKFEVGQGIIGKAAETKKVIFVPNTSKDKAFVSQEGDTPKALLCVPLVDKDVLIGVINLSGDVKNVTFADSDYEFVSTVARSLVTTIKNIRMREVIEEQNRNLEAKVEERTAELAQKNKDIASMMANMHQGLFTITVGGLIHQEYAAYLEEIFETDRIADRNFADLLFANTTTGSDSVDQNITAVDAIVGEDEMMYEFNSHCLLETMTIRMEDGREKILEMDWDPIHNDMEEVDKLMVTVRDVTELKALEAEAEGQKKELAIIGEILAVDAGKFNEFLTTSEAFLKECRDIIEATDTKDLDAIANLFRSMHTVKGNARTYGLSHITDIVHEVESTYDDLRKNEESVWDKAQLISELDGADEIVAKYAYVFKEKLGRDAESAQGVSLDPARVASWLDKIKAITEADMSTDVKGVVSDAYDMLISLDAKPISEVISDVIDSANSLADQLDKGRPNISIDDSNILIGSEAHSTLNNIFMHVFRNAMDHGIEGKEERAEKGKPESGNITLTTKVEDGFANLAVKDDNRGIAISKIYEMAIEKGIYAADAPKPAATEIANLIFSSGFSTADEVTDVSGRGVGMDAVKGFLEQDGGSIAVVLDEGGEEDDFRTFTTNIRLPESLYSVALEFAKSA